MPDFLTNKRLNSLPWCCITLISCTLTLSGCGSSAESHEDEHHSEHLEHFVPAHKPATFADLVDQLALRTQKLCETSRSSNGGGEQQTAMQEFSDIIGWIPELAADSELMKADFESVVATGNSITVVFAETLRTQQTKSFDAATIEPHIEELRKLVPLSQNQKDQM